MRFFVISGIIKVEVSVISRSRRLRLITLTETLIISDITKTESNNCFIIHRLKASNDKRIIAPNIVYFRHAMFLRPWQTRTHCCGHIVADTNVSPFARARSICCGQKFCVRDTKNVSDFVQKHFVSATIVSQFAQPKKHHGQQCVSNNASAFTRTFTSLLPSSCTAFSQAFAVN